MHVDEAWHEWLGLGVAYSVLTSSVVDHLRVCTGCGALKLGILLTEEGVKSSL